MDKIAELNKKIGEIKKRILLSDGQRKATSEEWEKQKTNNYTLIVTTKRQIKELTTKLTGLQSSGSYSPAETSYTISRVKYPVGAHSPDDAIRIIDMKVIDNRKNLDLLNDKYKKRHVLFSKLLEDYRSLLNYTEKSKQENHGNKPAETLEEENNKKMVYQLENEIHRTKVQCTEAEHIRKKYKSIRSCLMTDAERFEKSLKELEETLAKQQSEINRLQTVHREALDMRDNAKSVLQKQEQQSIQSNKMREKQAMEFRKEVEERKLELERIERKLFSSGKTFVHQESVSSMSGDYVTQTKSEVPTDPAQILKCQSREMETLFKTLMRVTGATSSQEVLSRFHMQKESMTRLVYLRKTAEDEKEMLEKSRDDLLKELERTKFTDISENDINQETIEKIKTSISDCLEDKSKSQQLAKRTESLMKDILGELSEIIFKLQDFNEGVLRTNLMMSLDNFDMYLKTKASQDVYINVLSEMLEKYKEYNAESVQEKLILETEALEDFSSIKSSARQPSSIHDEKLPLIPACYYNLMAGRFQGGTPGQTPQPTGTDDENEVPTRLYLKKQSAMIMDSKSRRKGGRPMVVRRK
ncbi:CCDC151 family protein [Megaselia abdita]